MAEGGVAGTGGGVFEIAEGGGKDAGPEAVGRGGGFRCKHGEGIHGLGEAVGFQFFLRGGEGKNGIQRGHGDDQGFQAGVDDGDGEGIRKSGGAGLESEGKRGFGDAGCSELGRRGSDVDGLFGGNPVFSFQRGGVGSDGERRAGEQGWIVLDEIAEDGDGGMPTEFDFAFGGKITQAEGSVGQRPGVADFADEPFEFAGDSLHVRNSDVGFSAERDQACGVSGGGGSGESVDFFEGELFHGGGKGNYHL